MSTNWIPSRESEFDPFANNFQTKIAADPTDYALSSSDATSITAAYNSWHAAYVAAITETTRTRDTIETKNLQKANMLSVMRRYAALIRPNTAVSNALKIGLGLRIADVDPTPVPPPTTYPVLSVAGGAPLEQLLRIADSATPTKRAKPAGAVGLLLFRAVGTTPATDPGQATFLAFTGKAKAETSFSASDNGKVATYFARWTNLRGELGPWSAPVSRTIAA